MSDYGKIDREVNALSDTIWDMATKVWSFAELGFAELESSAYEAGVLAKSGFKIGDRGIGGIDTAWIATWGKGAPVLGILVEFDALPDLGNEAVPTKTPRRDGITNGHGCGHNLIGSGAIGAAIALKNHMEKEGIPGTIKVFGCPAEELLAGKNYMAQAGAFDGLDACLHHHPGPINAAANFHSTAATDLWIEWEGTAAHAAQAPWDGRSSVQAAQLFLHGVDMMREHILPTIDSEGDGEATGRHGDHGLADAQCARGGELHRGRGRELEHADHGRHLRLMAARHPAAPVGLHRLQRNEHRTEGRGPGGPRHGEHWAGPDHRTGASPSRQGGVRQADRGQEVREPQCRTRPAGWPPRRRSKAELRLRHPRGHGALRNQRHQ